MKTLYLGFTSAAVPGWERFAPEPKAPLRWKDPSKIAEHIAAARAKQAEDASSNALTACLLDVAALDIQGKPVEVTYPVLTMLGGYALISCLDANLFRALAIGDYLQRCGSIKPEAQWILPVIGVYDTLSYGRPPLLVDPARLLTCSTAEAMTDPNAILGRYAPERAVRSAGGGPAMLNALLCKSISNLLGL
jgi:hypothetical protein